MCPACTPSEPARRVRSAVTLAVESLVGLAVAAATVTVNDVHVSAFAATPTGESVTIEVDTARL